MTQTSPIVLQRTWPVRCAFALWVAIAPSATAQSPAAGYAVTGQVLGADAAPLEHAQVRIEDRGGVVLRILQSDSAGRFVADRLSEAPLSVHVRALGYAPRSVAVK